MKTQYCVRLSLLYTPGQKFMDFFSVSCKTHIRDDLEMFLKLGINQIIFL